MKIFHSLSVGFFVFTLCLVFPLHVVAKRLKNGDVFPSIPLKSISQVRYQSADLKGNVVVYDIGASWVKGGNKALSYYSELLRSLKKNGLRIVIVNIDDDLATTLDHIKVVKNVLPVLYDAKKDFVRKLDPIGFPIVYIADRKGVVRDIIRDYCENEFELLKERILKVLNDKLK